MTILAPTNRRVIRPYDKPSFEHTQRYGLVKGHWANEGRVGLWLFNEGSGGQVFDLSGNGREMSFVNSPVWSSGKFVPAILFTDTSSQYLTNANAVISGTPCTFVAWVRAADLTGEKRIITVNAGDTTANVLSILLDDSTNKLQVQQYDNNDASSFSTVAMTVNVWHHCVGVFASDSSRTAYLDGVAGPENTDVQSAMSGLNVTDIGALYWSGGRTQFWSGDIAMVTIYNLALSASEIAELLWNPFAGIEKRAAPVYFFVPTDVDVTVEPATLGLALTQHAPDVSIDVTVEPAAQALALTQHAPEILTGIIVTPPTLALAVTLHAPTHVISTTVSPAALALALTLHAPTIITTGGVTVLPATFALEAALHAPEIITRLAEIPPFMHKDLIDPYSGGAWLWLCEITVPGHNAVRIARNTENVHYGEYEYERFNLQIGEQTFSSDGSIPRVTLRVFQDISRKMEDIVNETEGALGAQVKLIRVNEKYLATPVAALEADYDNLASESDTEWVTFTLGIPNPLTQRFPLRNYSSSMCPEAHPDLFKGPVCQYPGADLSCLGTYEDCYKKGNAVHWGGELGLDPSVVKVYR